MHTRVTSSWIKHLDFIFADLICMNITFLFAYFLRMGRFSNMYADDGYRMLIIVMLILHFCIAFFSNYYSGILRRGYLKEFRVVLTHNLVLSGLMLGYMFLVRISGDYSRILLVSFFMMDSIVMYMTHIIMKYLQRRNLKQDAQNLLILTTESRAEKAIQKVMDGPDKRYHIIGLAVTDRQCPGEIQGIPVVATRAEVFDYACHHVVDDVYIDLDPTDKNLIENCSNAFLTMGIAVHVNMDLFIENAPNPHFEHINAATVMTTSINSVTTTELFLKRVLDICAGVAGCLITLLLAIFIAPAIKIADPKGPIFFGQDRVGRNGRVFRFYKFRSMYADAEERKKELMKDNKMDGLMFKIDADPRIIGSGPDGTKKGLGHFLRATSLDEFPNFWSILKGDMSLVGTRPPTMDEYERYEMHHKSRLAAKPGLTGMWQVSGRSDMTDFEEIVKLDNEYIKNWSIGLDIRIILKTFVVVITRKGSV